MSRKKRKSKAKRIALAGICLVVAGIVVALALASCLSAGRDTRPTIFALPAPDSEAEALTPIAKTTLRVMTLNLAHGRKEGPHQALRKSATIRSNLDEIAAVLNRVRPDIVALQEADGPSFWSGGFNHIQYLAETASFPFRVRGEHVKGKGLSYGTALLSMMPLSDPQSVTFAPSPPTFSKGFVACAIDWPGDSGVEVDVVSVHLDFARKSVRQKQVAEMIGKLPPRRRPLIIMGDFNCEWVAKEPTLKTLAAKLNLKAYQPEVADMTTFPSSKKRLDWILISPELEFVTYEVLPDVLSDHRAVVSELRLTGEVE